MKLATLIVKRWVPEHWRESVMGDIAEDAARRRARHRYAGVWWQAAAAVGACVALSREQRRSAPRLDWSGVPRDIRHAARALWHAPAFTAVAVAVLGLGIGATTAIFAVVDVSLLRPLPYPEPDRLVLLGEVGRDAALPYPEYVSAAAVQNYRDWAREQSSFSTFGAAALGRLTARGGDAPQQYWSLRATAGFLDALGVTPRLGQPLAARHEEPGNERVVLIGDHVWRARFQTDPDVVGRTLETDAGDYLVLGVLPPGFRFPATQLRPTDVVLPLVRTARGELRDRRLTGRTYNLRVVGRLNTGVSFEQARDEMSRIAATLEAAYPDWFEDQRFVMAPLHASTVGRTRTWMWLILAAVVCVLLVAAANVANLMLVRATSRVREWHVRAALGASRWQLMRGALVESLLLAAMGLAVAALLAAWGVNLLQVTMPASVPRIGALGVDTRVFAFAGSVALVVGLVCGLLPAWQVSRGVRNDRLREDGRHGTASRSRQFVRSALMTAEVALASMLAVGAALFASSFLRVTAVELGIDVRNVVAVSINSGVSLTDEASFVRAKAAALQRVSDAHTRIRGLAEVTSAAIVGSGEPLSGGWRTNAVVVGGREFAGEDEVQIKEVSSGYREVLRLPLMSGRFIADTDTEGAPPVMVVNEEAVSRYFGGDDPLGKVVTLEDVGYTVVGVVGNVRAQGPESRQAAECYLPYAQRPGYGATIVARGRDGAEGLEAAVKSAAQQVMPEAVVTPRVLEAALREMTAQRRFNMMLVGAFGALALVIAAVGIYGVMAFSVSQRTREIGVRMALGAVPWGVLLLVLRQATVHVALGLLVGLGGAWFISTRLDAFLFSVSARDPWIFATSGSVLLIVGLLAAAAPALRAARVDPVTALRQE
jgi:putative ABC transport system permease protein